MTIAITCRALTWICKLCNRSQTSKQSFVSRCRVHSVNIVNILWRTALKLEYLNQIGRPLLDNGSVTGFPVSLSGWQTRSRDNVYIDRCFLHNGGVVFVTTDKPKYSTRCSLLGWRKSVLRRCRCGIEYLHRSPASRRRQQNRKFRIWDSKIWSRVPRESDPRMNELARASSNCKWQTHPLVREDVI
jgi:hypothetical protein